MVMKCPAVCLVALSLLCSLCDGQWRGFYRPSPRAYPIPRATVTNQNTQYLDDQQSNQPGPALQWKYPKPPEGENIPVGTDQTTVHVPPHSVAVECRDTDAYVEVKEDFFGTGQLISPTDLTMGSCGATAEDSAAKVLIFDVQLQDCGSTLSMTNDSIIYSFILNYNPQPVGDIPVVRTRSAAVIVQCHYPRMQNVSSLPITPSWSPFSAVRMAQEYLYFNMTLMTSDWKYLRSSNEYIMGEMINVQVSVMQYFHVPLRIYVDSCIATTTNDVTSSPSYIFIDNGCMLDGILTGSSSQFMDRIVENKLRFQLDAFMFQGVTIGSLYITCHLIATTTSYPIDASHRACSYINGWKEASGVNAACASCFSGGTIPSAPSSFPNVVTGSGTVPSSSGATVGTTGTSGAAGVGTASSPSGSYVGGLVDSPGAADLSGTINAGFGSPGTITTGVGSPGTITTGVGSAGTGSSDNSIPVPSSTTVTTTGSGSSDTASSPTTNTGPITTSTGSSDTGYTGTGNTGTGNTGTGYTGTGYTGTGYIGVDNTGTGNTGTGYTGTGYTGTGYIGVDNTGTGNTGTGYTGTGYTGTGYTDTGYTGIDNTGPGYIGVDNTGTGYTGTGYTDTGYTGTGYIGVGYTGLDNTGTGYTGLDNTGTGYTGIVYADVGNTGTGNTGTGYTGTGNTGTGYTGVGYTGTGNTGTGYTGTGYRGVGKTGTGYTGTVYGGFGKTYRQPHHPHPGRRTRDVSPKEIFEWEAEVCLGPIKIKEKVHV